MSSMDIMNSMISLATLNEAKQIDDLIGTSPSSSVDVPGSSIVTSGLLTLGNDTTESDIKKLFTAASKIAQEKEFDGFPKIGSMPTAIISDNLFTGAKTAYQLASGNISVDDVAEIVADKATVVCDCIASIITPDTIELGLNRMVDFLTVATSCPQIQLLKSYTGALSQWIAPAVQNTIIAGKKMLSSAIHTSVRKAGNWLKNKASKIASKIPLFS